MVSRAAATRTDSPDGAPTVVEPSRQRPLSSHGVTGDALIAEVSGSLDTLKELMQHGEPLGQAVASTLGSTVRDVEQRLSRTELCFAVVGEPDSGKRTFLDALVGVRALGAALKGTQAIVILRRRDAIDYRARLAGGRVEQFSRDVPDRSAELDRAIAVASRALGQAEANSAKLDSDARVAADAERRAADALGTALATLEGKRLDAIQLGAELDTAESKAERVKKELVAIERAVPESTRVRPDWWAAWLWLWRAAFILLFSGRYRRYRQGARERDEALAELASAKQRAERNAEECQLTETELGPIGAAAQANREEARDADAARAQASSHLEQARAALENARLALALHTRERREQFFAKIETLVRAGAGRMLREIEIDFPASLLPEDVAILDIPEITDQAIQESARVWSLIRDRADGCVLISELDRAVSGATKRFLHKLRDVVPHVLLVLTKMDRAFVEATRRGNAMPWEEVDKARRIGTRRFAREIGRDPEAVFGLAVAARAALDDSGSGLSRRFKVEVDKLFQLLRHERAIILGTRSATAIRSCIAGLGEARDTALGVYSERILDLEKRRTPSPEAFKAEALAATQRRAAAARTDTMREASEAAHGALDALRVNCRQTLSQARGRRNVLEAARRAQAELEAGVASARAAAQKTLESAIDQRVRVIEQDLFADLRRRYHLIHEVRRSQSSIPRLEEAGETTSTAIMLPAVEAAATTLTRVLVAASIAGGVVGALAGHLIAPAVAGVLAHGPIAPVIGAVIGLALGALFAVIPTRTRLKRKAAATLDAEVDQAESRIHEQLQASADSVEQAIHDALDRSLERVLTRHARQITELLEAEAAAIVQEREALASLERLGPALSDHDEKLSKAIEAAINASAGLCR